MKKKKENYDESQFCLSPGLKMFLSGLLMTVLVGESVLLSVAFLIPTRRTRGIEKLLLIVNNQGEASHEFMMLLSYSIGAARILSIFLAFCMMCYCSPLLNTKIQRSEVLFIFVLVGFLLTDIFLGLYVK